jgi:two-component system response regulator ResD
MMSRTVLLVNDNAVSRRNLAQFLADEGYVVEQAEDAEQALKLLSSREFDVVIAGYVVRGQCVGVDIFRACPASGKIMYTSYPAENVQPVAESIGALLVRKPAPFEELLHAVRTVQPAA